MERQERFNPRAKSGGCGYVFLALIILAAIISFASSGSRDAAVLVQYDEVTEEVVGTVEDIRVTGTDNKITACKFFLKTERAGIFEFTPNDLYGPEELNRCSLIRIGDKFRLILLERFKDGEPTPVDRYTFVGETKGFPVP